MWLLVKWSQHDWGLFEGEIGRRFVNFLKNKGYDGAIFEEHDEPKIGIITDIGPLEIIKIRKNKKSVPLFRFTSYKDCIAKDSKGWKYWFRCIPDRSYTKDFNPKIGQVITLRKCIINENKTGISFIRDIDKIVIIKS